MKQELSLTYLRSVLDYDPATGVLTWKNGSRCGSIAGCIQKRGYRTIGLRGVEFYAHRLVWFMIHGRWPIGIDHINGVKADNRICNLREATQSQNIANSGAKSASGLKGAYYHRKKGKWYSRILKQHLGYFDTKEEAHLAWAKMAKETHGEFARIE